jgi:hypothetical protein
MKLIIANYKERYKETQENDNSNPPKASNLVMAGHFRRSDSAPPHCAIMTLEAKKFFVARRISCIKMS